MACGVARSGRARASLPPVLRAGRHPPGTSAQAPVRQSEADRDELIPVRQGLCVICLKGPAAHVDHCRSTGSVPGVPCFNCNSAIGKLGDDPDVVRRVIAYLGGNSWKPILVAPGVYQLPS